MTDQELLSHCNEYLNYDPETGVLTWKKRGKGRRVNGIAGSLVPSGYISIKLNRVKYMAHRLAFLMTYEYLPTYIDHKNRIKDDNSIANLRECSNRQNACNRGATSRNKSGYKGVYLEKKTNSWYSQININGNIKHLGTFVCKIKAAKAYDKAAQELHGSFAYLNFPVPNVAAASDAFGSG